MDFQHTAIFCDLDGTLFTPEGHVSPRTAEAIRAYTQGGGSFAVATGRAPSNTEPFLDPTLFNAPGIVLNGAGLYDFASHSYYLRHFADREALKAAVTYCVAHFPGMNLQVYTEQDIVYVSPRETANEGFLQLHTPCRFLPLAAIEDSAWFKALLFGTPEQTLQLQQYLKESGLLSRVDSVLTGTDIVKDAKYLELLPLGINKGTMLEECRSLPPFRGRTIFAAGDGNNDLEMLLAADYGAAPANAGRAVLEQADIRLPSNREDCIAKLIDHIKAM